MYCERATWKESFTGEYKGEKIERDILWGWGWDEVLQTGGLRDEEEEER